MDAEPSSSDLEIIDRAEEILRASTRTWSVRWRLLLRDLYWTTDVYVVGFANR